MPHEPVLVLQLNWQGCAVLLMQPCSEGWTVWHWSSSGLTQSLLMQVPVLPSSCVQRERGGRNDPGQYGCTPSHTASTWQGAEGSAARPHSVPAASSAPLEQQAPPRAHGLGVVKQSPLCEISSVTLLLEHGEKVRTLFNRYVLLTEGYMMKRPPSVSSGQHEPLPCGEQSCLCGREWVGYG